MASPTAGHTAFFYGTLMSPRVLSRVCHGPDLPDSTTRDLHNLTFKPALLPNHRRHRVKSADYPGMVPHASSSVRGTLVAGLNDGDMYRLDIFEGSEYSRQRVTVKLLPAEVEARITKSAIGDGVLAGHVADEEFVTEVPAETYIWTAPREDLQEEEWDFDQFVREKMWRWVGRQAEEEGEFEELDGAVAVQADGTGIEDPTRGRGLNGSISKVLDEKEKQEEVLRSAV
jgi:hypothetical protein